MIFFITFSCKIFGGLKIITTFAVLMVKINQRNFNLIVELSPEAHLDHVAEGFLILINMDDTKLNIITGMCGSDYLRLKGENKIGYEGVDMRNENWLRIYPSQYGKDYFYISVVRLISKDEEYNERPFDINYIDIACAAWGLRIEDFKFRAKEMSPLPVDHHKMKQILKTTNIYFIQEDGCGYVKIGRSIGGSYRLHEMERDNPHKLTLVKLIENVPIGTEAELHKKYSKYHHKGEWYHPELLNNIN